MKRAMPVLVALLLLGAAAVSRADLCNVTATLLNFGPYDVFSSVPRDATATITLLCTNPPQKNLPVTITLTSGGAGAFNPRQMGTASGDRLDYNLFTNSTMSAIWGDGTGGSSTLTNVVNKNLPWNATVFGRVPAGQDVRVGSYSDTITVTVLW